MRASAVVKRQLMPTACPLRLVCQAATSCSSSAREPMRRSKHCRMSTENSISAMFNQLPCLGVECRSSFSIRRRASAGSNTSYKAERRMGVQVLPDQHQLLSSRIVDIHQVANEAGEVC